jgi:hypothetical protein
VTMDRDAAGRSFRADFAACHATRARHHQIAGDRGVVERLGDLSGYVQLSRGSLDIDFSDGIKEIDIATHRLDLDCAGVLYMNASGSSRDHRVSFQIGQLDVSRSTLDLDAGTDGSEQLQVSHMKGAVAIELEPPAALSSAGRNQTDCFDRAVCHGQLRFPSGSSKHFHFSRRGRNLDADRSA